MSTADAQKSSERLHILKPETGWSLICIGALTLGYSAWSYVQSRAYLDEVEASGQVVGAFDAVNYFMSSSGLYVLLGLLLAAHGGIYLALRLKSPREDPDPDSLKLSGAPASSVASPQSSRAGQSSASADEDDLDKLLRRVDDTP